MDLKELAVNEGKSRHPWEIIRVRVVRQLISRCYPTTKSLNILDVGSGDTYLIKTLSDDLLNSSFFAVDNGYEKEFMVNHNNNFDAGMKKIRLFNEMQAVAGVIQGDVDLVLMLDVIEHVPDDVQFLKDVMSLPFITDQTIFLITVPSYQALFCSHDVFLGHYRRYDNRLLRKNTQKANLKTISIGYFFIIPLMFRVVEVLVEKVKKNKEVVTGIGGWNGSPLLTKILLVLLQIDYFFTRTLGSVKIKLPGLSNFAICKKSGS